MLSERTIQEIKYDGMTPQFMAWLAKTKIFLYLQLHFQEFVFWQKMRMIKKNRLH